MYGMGIDVGSSGVKGLVLNEHVILATHKYETLAPGSETAQEVMHVLIQKVGCKRKDVFVIVTGMGTERLQFADGKKQYLLVLPGEPGGITKTPVLSWTLELIRPRL